LQFSLLFLFRQPGWITKVITSIKRLPQPASKIEVTAIASIARIATMLQLRLAENEQKTPAGAAAVWANACQLPEFLD
jgi:hypothetical protein